MEQWMNIQTIHFKVQCNVSLFKLIKIEIYFSVEQTELNFICCYYFLFDQYLSLNITLNAPFINN